MKDLRSGAPRRLTMADVAAHAGVSRQTVSLVLADKPGPSSDTRRAVLESVAALDFRPDVAAQLLRSARSRQLGVLFSMEHAHDPLVIEALYDVAAHHEYSLVLSAAAPVRGVRSAVDELVGLHCEGVIILGLDVEEPEHLAEVARRMPVVEVAQRSGVAGVETVRTDDAAGTRLAVDHLVGLGHREILHLGGGAEPGAPERREGYLYAMADHDLVERIEVLEGDFTEESGVAAGTALLERPRLPTAVIAANDLAARGLVETFLRAGTGVPEQISVIGYDDSRVAALQHLGLTTVHQDPVAMAELALEACAERLEGRRDHALDVVLPPSLTVRTTTAHPRR